MPEFLSYYRKIKGLLDQIKEYENGIAFVEVCCPFVPVF